MVHSVKTVPGELLWHAHVSELLSNNKAAIMQIKELKEVLNGQCDIIIKLLNILFVL